MSCFLGKTIVLELFIAEEDAEYHKFNKIFWKQQEWINNILYQKVALYFAWLGFYTAFLIPASLVGILCFLYGVVGALNAPTVEDACTDFPGPGGQWSILISTYSWSFKRKKYTLYKLLSKFGVLYILIWLSLCLLFLSYNFLKFPMFFWAS